MNYFQTVFCQYPGCRESAAHRVSYCSTHQRQLAAVGDRDENEDFLMVENVSPAPSIADLDPFN